MFRVLESKIVYASVAASLALGVCMCILMGGSMPTFGASLLPEPNPVYVSQSPLPPPDPGTPWVTLAQSPLPPPDPGTPWVTLAQSPLPPPDPGTPWVTLAQSPLPPPDPGTPG